MKKTILKISFALAALIVLHACVKSLSNANHIQVYTPIVESMTAVRAKIKNSVPLPVTNAGKLFVIGNYVFLNEKNRGIHIINNTNPSSPVNQAFINIPGNSDIMLKGNILYADCYTDLVTIDVSNPNAIEVKDAIADVFTDKLYWSGFATNPGEVVTGFAAKDTTIDFTIPQGTAYYYGNRYIGNNVNLDDVVANGSWPSNGNVFLTATAGAATATGKAGSMSRFALINDYLYAVTNSTLHAIDVSNAVKPVKMDSKGLGWSIETIYPFKDKLFIGSRNGMFIYDVSNPAMPTYVSTFAHAELCDPVIVDGNYAYITLHSNNLNNVSGGIVGFCQGTRNEMNVVDVSNLSNPSLLNTITLTQPKGLSKDGNTLIVCDGDAGLRIFNAANPQLPVLQQTISLANSYDVICNNGIALVSAKDGLYQYSYSNPNNIVRLSKFAF